MRGRYLGEPHTFFTPEQLEKDREKRKKKTDPSEHVQCEFFREIRGLSKAEHKWKLRNELMKENEK